MRLKTLLPGGALALSLVMGGCGDSTGSNTITLSASETKALFFQIQGALSNTDAEGALGVRASRVAGNGPLFARIPGPAFDATGSISKTVTCSAGNIAVSGSVTAPNLDVTETFNACQAAGFLIGGSLTISGTFTALSIYMTIKGSLTLSADAGRSGNCVVDFSITTSGSTATLAGTICGVGDLKNTLDFS